MPVRCSYGSLQLSGVKDRLAMCSGRGWSAPKGSVSAFSTLLNTRKMFERGNGVMLLPDPCMMFESNHRADPAGPVNWSMPRRWAISVMTSVLGTPTVCSFSEEAWLFSGVAPTLGMRSEERRVGKEGRDGWVRTEGRR